MKLTAHAEGPLLRAEDLLRGLDDLGAASERLSAVVERLATAAEVPRHEVDLAIDDVLTRGRELREMIARAAAIVGLDRPVQVTKEDLASTVRTLSELLSSQDVDRDHLARIAAELRNGAVVHRLAAPRARLDTLRARALKEVEDVLAEAQLNAQIPWPVPDPDTWLPWILCLEEPEASEAHRSLEISLPALFEFVISLENGMWISSATASDASTSALHVPSAGPVRDLDAKPCLAAAAPAEAKPRQDAASGDDQQLSPEQLAHAHTEEHPTASIHLVTSAPAHAGTSHEATEVITIVEPIPSSAPRLSQQTPAADPDELPPALRTFEAFSSSHWRGPNGDISPAPWREATFAQAVEEAAERSFRDRRWSHLMVFSRAAEKMAASQVPPPRDVEALLALIGRPESDGSGIDPVRAVSVAASSDEVRPSFRVRLALFLEALRPSLDAPISTGTFQQLVDGAGFCSDALQRFLLCAYRVGLEGGQALETLRRLQNQAPKEDARDLAARHKEARDRVRACVRKLWSGAGGKIKTTHCREIWQQFMAHAQPTFDELGAPVPTRDVDPKELETLRKRFDSLADRGGAKYSDRSKMDRAVDELLQAGRDVIYSGRRLSTVSAKAAPATRAALDLEASLRGLPNVGDDVHAAFVGLLRDLITSVGSSPVLPLLTNADFLARVALLEAVPIVLDGGQTSGADAREIANPVAAAALLMLPAADVGAPKAGSMSRHLHEIGRDDLLLHLQPTSDREARYASTALVNAQISLQRAIASARQVDRQLDEAAHPLHRHLTEVIQEAERLSRECPPHEVRPELLAEWVARSAECGERAVSQTITTMRARLGERTDELSGRIGRALDQGHFAEAHALFIGEPLQRPDNLRATMTRREAEAKHPNIHGALRSAHGQVAPLRDLWLRGPTNEDQRRELRNAFASFVFDVITKRNKGAVVDRKNRGQGAAIVCTLIRQWITDSNLNPTFVPQITRFREILISTPTVRPTEASFVRETAEASARGADARITVVLAPQLSKNVRGAFLDELRKRSLTGVAILDDLDLVRLINPGGQQPDLPLALLELVMEQQPRWVSISPFEAQDGQHTKAEMYVGRREEADSLATRNVYSRLFSGRRLGKSALLKHISDTHDSRKLPSRYKLRVAYVPIVGIDDEAQVVDAIQAEFEKHFDYRVKPIGGTAPERLKALMDGFLRDQPKVSVLVFLDEADMFVAAQIRKYDESKEACLTWWMRTALESLKDAMDHPRVRFVFAGYRATHLAEGAWANWGDVLRLQPLAPDEAIRLIAGPLARLGIDASNEASNIAFRCGYQPAVILRFGQQLLEHLDATVPPAGREGAVVTPEHVTQVYQHPVVQLEIRTVVWNNFQGNPFAKVVFAALLLEFAGLPPGGQLEDAPRQVFERLRQISPDFLSSASVKGAPIDRVARELRGFADRSLLVESADTAQAFRLRFPHHLSVLLLEDQEAIILQETQALGTEPDHIDSIRSMLSDTALESISLVLGPDGPAAGISMAVAASHWSRSLQIGAARIATRLGLDDSDDHGRPKAMVDVSAAKAGQLATLYSTTSPSATAGPLLVGGIDLLRWALSTDAAVEMVAVGRIGLLHLRWWFERVRGINFAGFNPGPRFLEVTGGIPYLVALLDDELKERVAIDGDTASEATVAETLRGYEERFEAHVGRLVQGQPATALESREIDLLIMYVRACKDLDTGWREAMQAWNEWAPIVGWPEELHVLRSLGAPDIVPLNVLIRSGLVPVDVTATRADPLDRIAALSASDPLNRVAEILEKCRSR